MRIAPAANIFPIEAFALNGDDAAGVVFVFRPPQRLVPSQLGYDDILRRQKVYQPAKEVALNLSRKSLLVKFVVAQSEKLDLEGFARRIDVIHDVSCRARCGFERHLRIKVEILTEFVDDGGNLQTTEDRHKISVMGRSNYAMKIDGECADEYVRHFKLVENVDNSSLLVPRSSSALLQSPLQFQPRGQPLSDLLFADAGILAANAGFSNLASVFKKFRAGEHALLRSHGPGSKHFFPIELVPEFFRRFHKCLHFLF